MKALTILDDVFAFVVGKRGYGKTWRVARLALKYHARFGRVVLYDPTGSLSSEVGDTRGWREDVTVDVVETREELLSEYKQDGEDCLFVVDEIDSLSRHGKDREVMDMIYDLSNYGRHKRQGLLATARRVVTIPMEVRNEAHEVFIFRTTNPVDLRTLEGWGLERTSVSRVRRLGVGECIRLEV